MLDQTVTEDTELISIYYGADVSQQEAQMIKQYAEEKFSDCEIELQKGGQPLYYYIISIE